MTILEDIINHKKTEVKKAKNKTSLSTLERSRFFQRSTLSLSSEIMNPDKTGIIAEFKRKSPSKGTINDQSSIEEVTTGYFRSGASGLSILTDTEFFGGSITDLKRARSLNQIPILRKDFIIDEYQIAESKAIGADVVLLIAAVLEKDRLKELAFYARKLQLEVLLEIHEASELDHLNEYVNIVGVNNRDLKTFKVDVERSIRLAYDIPNGFVKISESGIHSSLIIKTLRGCGYQGFLIGESFMRSPEPAKAFSDFVENIILER
jgi:indole-3-glycerol phosphate synthase